MATFVLLAPAELSKFGSEGGSLTTELLDDDEDRIPEENIDRADAEDFLLANLLLVNDVCDALLESGGVELGDE
jgi:hypothetical protein